jgi:hypothetical protein
VYTYIYICVRDDRSVYVCTLFARTQVYTRACACAYTYIYIYIYIYIYMHVYMCI